MKGGLIAVMSAGVLGTLGTLLWYLQFETTGQLFWVLATLVFIWSLMRFSLLLRSRFHQERKHLPD